MSVLPVEYLTLLTPYLELSGLLSLSQVSKYYHRVLPLPKTVTVVLEYYYTKRSMISIATVYLGSASHEPSVIKHIPRIPLLASLPTGGSLPATRSPSEPEYKIHRLSMPLSRVVDMVKGNSWYILCHDGYEPMQGLIATLDKFLWLVDSTYPGHRFRLCTVKHTAVIGPIFSHEAKVSLPSEQEKKHALISAYIGKVSKRDSLEISGRNPYAVFTSKGEFIYYRGELSGHGTDVGYVPPYYLCVELKGLWRGDTDEIPFLRDIGRVVSKYNVV